ncbi:MAG: hypothetical protein HRT53_08840 [Colwellia sp.]|nr:hypothetical protein [Colwellia sp.]
MKLFSIALSLSLFLIYNNDLLAHPIETEAEYKEIIVKQHKDLLAKFSQSSLVVSSLLEANKKNVGIVKIMQLDANWQLNRKLQKSVMQTSLASQIIEFIKNPTFDISEMMVLDKNGVLVAVSPKPTDYWQGDEDKFQQPIRINGDYIGPTKWDSSASTYQFFYCLLIKDEDQKVIGVLVTGLDVTKQYLEHQSIQNQ